MFNFSNSVFKLRSISESDVIKDIRTFMLPGENIVSAFDPEEIRLYLLIKE